MSPAERRLDPTRPDLRVHLDRLAATYGYQESPQLLLLADDPSPPASALRVAFSRIEDLADETGHDALLAVAGEQLGLTDLDPAALALVAWIEKPELFERAEARLGETGTRRFREFPGREIVPAVSPDDVALRSLACRLADHFEARGRTRYCRVELLAQTRTLAFQVRRGRPLRCEASLEGDESGTTEVREAWATYRPRGVDLVIFDRRTGRLKVSAPDAATLQAYVAGFGELLFGDRGWFRIGSVVSLGPLVELGRDALRPTPGIASVELVSVDVALGDELGSEVTVRGRDVFTVLERYAPIRLVDGVLRSAKLKVRYGSGGRGRTLTLTPPDQAALDHRRDEGVTRAFLEARGFVAALAVR